jgi:cbb3-type cytochrome oxidase maturation protein
MESLYLLIPIALVFCAIALWLLYWAVDDGQYDDLDREAWRILQDSKPEPPPGPDVSAGGEADGADAAEETDDVQR